MSFRRLWQSFHDALRGVAYVFRNEQNFRIQTALAVLTIAASFYFPLRVWEQVLVLLLIMIVLTTELLNTALEKFSDLLKPRLHSYVGIIKDIMAGVVFLTSVGAFVIGLIIFLPYLVNLLK